jgi:hypothetical protein
VSKLTSPGHSDFQKVANEVAGGEAVFHPEIVDQLRRTQSAEGLQRLATDGWQFSEELPENWKKHVSTYLKAWAFGLCPTVLLDLAGLLTKAGYKSEAQEALQVALLYPTYASDPCSQLAKLVVKSAGEAFQRL